MSLPREFTKHGTFIYLPGPTIQRYGSPELVASAMKDLGMSHAWVRMHDKDTLLPKEPLHSLVEALHAAKIAVAGWGWCQGVDPKAEAALALKGLSRWGLTHYIADIEQGVHGSNWTPAEVRTFLSELRTGMAKKAIIGMSSFPYIEWHAPELMIAAEPLVDLFAPQMYWHNHPNMKMIRDQGVSVKDYPLDDPDSYVRLCMRQWRKITQKPLVFTGQAYWGEQGFEQKPAEAKLQSFLAKFKNWDDIVGFNWWHLGGKDQMAMSYSMYTAIKAADIASQF